MEEKLIDLLRECKLQLEYLNQKFQETGTATGLLGKINFTLNLYDNEQAKQ
jgi:hypothetical protein